MEINCTNCIYLSEDLASGTGETFCSCSEVDWYPEKFDSSINYASECDFFSQVQVSMSKSEIDKQICSVAENYVITQYYRAGDRSYAWDETDYRSNDLDEEEIVTGECPPSDADHYSWWEIISSEIHSSEITERNDETGEYSVTVEAWIAVSSGDEDEEVDENVSPDLREIYVQVDRDKDGNFYVAGIEE